MDGLKEERDISRKRLEDHYAKKYIQDAHEGGIETIPLVAYPSSRFEAAIKNLLESQVGGDVLELGAGNGVIAKTLLEVLPGIASYTATEISAPRLKSMGDNIRDPRLRVIPLDAENLQGMEEGGFDLIIMIALIEHLVDPLGAMGRLRKLLKPGGAVYIDTPNIAKYTRRLKLMLGRFPSTASSAEGLITYEGREVDLFDEGHLHYYTYRSLSAMLVRRCGFSRVRKFVSPGGGSPFGKHLGYAMAKAWPEMFSDVVILAYA